MQLESLWYILISSKSILNEPETIIYEAEILDSLQQYQYYNGLSKVVFQAYFEKNPCILQLFFSTQRRSEIILDLSGRISKKKIRLRNIKKFSKIYKVDSTRQTLHYILIMRRI